MQNFDLSLLTIGNIMEVQQKKLNERFQADENLKDLLC